MDIYLPIAELSVNAFLLLGLGVAVGAISGIFGVGGGFLLTPLLIFVGIPPSVAVGSVASQILASSVSGVLAHMRRQNVDFKMGAILTIGGVLGSALGVYLFGLLAAAGQVDLLVSLLYVVFLGVIGGLMLWESLIALVQRRRGKVPKRKRHGWAHRLPLKMRFPRSQLYISALLPAMIGASVGLLGALLGIGGGFIMVPAMIYLIGMPTQVVVGTSLFQIAFVMAVTTYLHAVTNSTVDIVLALLLIVGGVVGAQIGTRLGGRLRGDQLRILLALLVLSVCAKLLFDLIVVPAEPFSVDIRLI